MKKKLLFVIPTLDLGGAEKSLINLLQSIDYEKYEVDLFMFVKRGVFLDLIPKKVKVLKNSSNYKLFSRSVFYAIPLFIFSGKFKLAFHRLLFAVKNRYIRKSSVNEQYTWKHVSLFLPKIKTFYDLSVGYLEKSTYYFVADNTLGKRKVGWIHTDLEALKLDFNFEKGYFDKLDYLVTVSEGLTARLCLKLPDIKNKTFTIENINSEKSINLLANESTDIKFSKTNFNIIFVGRLVKEKGLFLAIDAIKILVEKNINVKFYIVGKGNMEKELKKYIKQKGLQKNIIFLGMQSNPYVLIKQADVFLMSSYYEGKSIALEEAKILLKPIVITNFSSAKDQIKDQITGLIAEMNAVSIAEKLLLCTDKTCREKLTNNLKQEKLGNENEVEKLYKLIND